jgi:hypothetical protein
MANTISQISATNTFQEWLTATQSLIGVANNLTNGDGSTFYANTRLEIGGTGASLNVVTGATINEQYSNTINTVNLVVTQNIAQANITNTLKVGNDAVVYDTLTVFGNTTLNTNLDVVGTANITGDLNVSGNINLDSIGFDDLNVAGSGSFGNTLNVTGATTISTVAHSIATPSITTLNMMDDGSQHDYYQPKDYQQNYRCLNIIAPFVERVLMLSWCCRCNHSHCSHTLLCFLSRT